jgi:DNA-formamidopyrimidine glycosylase
MPEVSEVALTSDILEKYLLGQTITSTQILSGRYSKKLPEGYTEFQKNLPMKVTKIDTKGKFLWFELKTNDNEKWFIWNTFGLTGMWSTKEMPNARFQMTTEKQNVYFSDTRNFGTLKFSHSSKALELKLKQLAPDFLKTKNINISKISKYKIPIYKILMDQKKIGSGLGNYLVPEILYRAKISPHRLGNSLTEKDLTNLLYWIKYTVKMAYTDNHTEYMVGLENEANKIKRKTYHPDVKDGKFVLKVYQQKKDSYGNPVKKDVIIKGRTVHWVPKIQK